MQIIYNIAIYLYLFGIRIFSLFNPKAKLWISGRRNLFENLKSQIPSHHSQIIWFHCASLGEFEQARPLIEKIKEQQPSFKILLTFFSPSGYEIRKNYAGADYIYYLPMDTPANVRKFVDIVKPSLVFFVKYEFWFNYLNELRRRNIPTYLVSGIFRENHYFFTSTSKWFQKQLKCFTHFYLQNEKSEELLNGIGYKNTTVTGDTRFDRVFDIAKNVKSFPLIEQFKQNNPVFICGSTWKEDEAIIADYVLRYFDRLSTGGAQDDKSITKFKLIIAPHEIDEAHINSLLLQFSNSQILLYSKANADNVKTADILIIDNIGMLSSLYQYGTVAYIGGGFGKGIHNILEAATFGLPVIFGSNYHKFNEAIELIHIGGAFSINNYQEFERTMNLLDDKMVLQTASHIAKYYVQSRVGATDEILNSISFPSLLPD